MARLLRVEFPGAIYHVTSRMVGNWSLDRGRLFVDTADRERFVERLGERVEQYNIRLYLFCLMSNHIHFVLETPAGNLGQFMQSLTTAYTVYYNLRHGRHGHLLQRYKAKLVESDNYLLMLSRYVHLNPVQTSSLKRQPLKNRIKYLRAYTWSSYPGYISPRKRHEFVEYAPMLAEMGRKSSEQPKKYRHYVESGLAETDEEFLEAMKESPRSIGSDEFRGWVDEIYNKLVAGYGQPEDVSFRHIIRPIPTESVLAVLTEVLGTSEEEFRRQRHNSLLRGWAARYLGKYSGLSQREVAKVVGVGSGAAVSQNLRRLTDALAKDRTLRNLAASIDERLDLLRDNPHEQG